ncbi:DUF4391 domain-containing protein [Collinsella sp. AM17-1]|uniref:DUF4391 domain-containing protein n=1 Tax=Collinsella sp. AM17-1 TaxID=2292027 RepID=UPI000E51E8A9|nr:DUF4391 domain-containing protein [Collinsella sp. AM17-1]RHH73540.1 DUF4391 family protein [Collinsella sp. AM17-1]
MSIDWNEIFELPAAALAGDRRIPKTEVARQAELTKREQKTLDKVKRLSYFATVQKSTTRILPFKDDEHDVESIVFLLCEMSGKSAAFSEAAGLLHRCFPNPTVLLMEGSGAICFSAALTRKSLSEKGAMVVEEQRSTGSLDPDDPQTRAMLEGLSFGALPQEDLLAYLREMMWRTRLVRASQTLGFYPGCDEKDKEGLLRLLAEVERLGKETSELAQARRDRELSLNEQMRLRVRLKEAESRRDHAVAEIKELCGGRD